MASKSVTLSMTAYTKLDTGTASAILIQNAGDAPVRVVLAASLPAASSAAYFVLQPGDGMPRDQMTGDMYAMADSSGLARVTVGE